MSTIFVCESSGKTIKAKSNRLPRGWKRIGGKLLCGDAVKSRYRTACVSIAVRWSDDKQANDDFHAVLNRGFSISTGLANWFIRELFVRDCCRTPDMEKLPTFNVPGLYQAAKERWPLDTTPSGLLAAMEHRIRGIYTAHRYAIVWQCSESLPSFRWPFSYPVRTQDYTLNLGSDGSMSVAVNIARERLTINLSQSHKYARQRAGLEKILGGDGKLGELLITRAKDGNVFVRFTGQFPKDEWTGKTGTLYVRTDSDSLIVAINAKEEKLWVYNADHLRRWVKERQRRKNRLSDDRKFEDRRRGRPVTFEQRSRAEVEKFRRRMDTATHQIALRIVGYAKRRKFGKIEYNESDKRFLDQFPYHELKTKLIDKANLAGIEVELVSK